MINLSSNISKKFFFRNGINSIFLILFSLCSLAISAQDTGGITGQFTTPSGVPLSFTQVKLVGTSYVATTDYEGNFTLKNIKPGKYTLEAHSLGFQDYKKEVNVEVGKITSMGKMSMSEGLVELNEVVIKTEEPEIKQVKESGFAVSSIETKDVEMQSIQTNELLDRTPGVRIRQGGGLGSNITYNINGLSGNSVRIFIDGVPISSYGPSFSLNSIPASMIERIDIYKGVVPAHLSTDALGGVINVVLKKAIRNSLSASYNYGSFNTHQANLNGVHRNNKNGFTVRGSGFYNYSDNSYEVWGDKVYVVGADGEAEYIKAKRFHDGYKSFGGKVDVGFTDVKWADQFLIGAVFSDMERDVQHGATMEIVYGSRRTTQNTKLISLQYDKRNIVKNLDVAVVANYSHLHRQTIDTSAWRWDWNGIRLPYKWASGAEGSAPTLLVNTEKNYTVRANVSYRIVPNHKLNINYLYNGFARDQDDELRSALERSLYNTNSLNKTVLSATYEAKWIKEKLKTQVFAKHYLQSVSLLDRKLNTSTREVVSTDYSRKVPTTGYGIALAYKLIPKVLLIGSVEKAVRMPNGTELLGNNADNVNPSYGLKPEQSQNANIGFNIGPVKVDKHAVSFNTNFFIRSTRDMIRQGIPTLVSETYQYENLENVKSQGVDVELLYQFKECFFINSNVAVFNARFNTERDPEGKKYSYYGARLRNEPYFTSNTNVRYFIKNVIQKESALTFYYNYAYVHEFFRDWGTIGLYNKPIIPVQTVHDLGLAYTLPNKKLTFGFDAKNITNKQLFDNWGLQKPGRAFYAKITYTII